jgi:hypothetical protein
MQRMLRYSSRDQQGAADGAPSPPGVLGRWLLLIYHLPSQPSSARSAIWRETKRLGALALQHGVCVLPATAAARAAYARLVRRVAEYGGEASVLETSSPDAAWQTKTVAQFNAARDEEYAEVVEETARFRTAIDRERTQGKFTFAELEDEVSNLERLRTYLAQVRARDAFGAAGQAKASAAVEQCAEVLAAFAEDISARQPAEAKAAARDEDDGDEALDALR